MHITQSLTTQNFSPSFDIEKKMSYNRSPVYSFDDTKNITESSTDNLLLGET